MPPADRREMDAPGRAEGTEHGRDAVGTQLADFPGAVLANRVLAVREHDGRGRAADLARQGGELEGRREDLALAEIVEGGLGWWFRG